MSAASGTLMWKGRRLSGGPSGTSASSAFLDSAFAERNAPSCAAARVMAAVPRKWRRLCLISSDIVNRFLFDSKMCRFNFFGGGLLEHDAGRKSWPNIKREKRIREFHRSRTIRQVKLPESSTNQ